MDYTISQYEIENVGNLLVMVCPDSRQLQMDSVIFTPYYEDLPLFLSDYMYIGEKRMFLNEIYSLVCENIRLYSQYIEKFLANKAKLDHLSDMPVKPCWYDDIRNRHRTSKATAKARFVAVLRRFYKIFSKNLFNPLDKTLMN